MVRRKKKRATLGISILPVLFLSIFLMFSMLDIEQFLGLSNFTCEPHMPLFFSAMFAAAVSILFLGYSWAELEDRIIETIKMSMGANLILLVIGMLIGTWIVSGIVPAMIYYGLYILSPKFFLIAAFIICSIVSSATGTSWGTAGTVGIALMGIGLGLNIDPAVSGGAIISGAYFGDKMSPISDTTNLAPAMAGATLYDHIRHMFYTTAPAYLISAVLFLLMGFLSGSGDLDPLAVSSLQDSLSSAYTSMSPYLLLGPLLVVAMILLKAPALPGLFFGTLVGGAFALVFQHADFNSVIQAFHYGYVSDTGNVIVDKLLSRGGMSSMLWTINLILCAMCFGGVMEKSGMLGVLSEASLKAAKGVGGLIAATAISCLFVNLITGNQYLSLVIPGRMYRKAYEQNNLAPVNLSRTLEDVGTVTSPLIPWNSCGATMIGALGILPWTYVPYCFFNLLCPVITVIYGYLGITIKKVNVPAAPIKNPEPPLVHQKPQETEPRTLPVHLGDSQGPSVCQAIVRPGAPLLIPLRPVLEAFGFTLADETPGERLRMVKGSLQTAVTAGSCQYEWGAAGCTLTTAPQTYQQLLTVPASFFQTNPHFHCKVTDTDITLTFTPLETPKTLSAEIATITKYSNGLGLALISEEGFRMLLYVTDKSLIEDSFTQTVLDKGALKSGTGGTFRFTTLVTQSGQVFNIATVIQLHGDMPEFLNQSASATA